jgi:O-antigen ligase
MTFKRLALGPRLSALSWFFIELFALLAVFLLPFSKSAAEVGITVALVLWALRKFPWNERFPDLPPCNVSYWLFLFFIVLSLYRIPPERLWDGFRGFVKWFQYLGIFFMGLDLFRDTKRSGRFAGAFFLSASALCLNGFYQLWTGRDLVKHYTADMPGRFTRMQSSLGSPNDLAAFLLVLLPIAFFWWWNEKKWSLKSALFVFVLVLAGLAFILTLSRSGFLALALAVVLYALVMRKKAVILPLAAALGALLLSGPLRYNFFGSLTFRDITIGERLRFWGETWELIKEHPFLGGGVNTFYDRFAAAATAGETFRGYAHNCYLQMWSEVGMLGLLAFLAPPVLILSRRLFRAAREKEPFALHHALWIACLAFFIQSFFDTNFYGLQTSMLFWFFWALFASHAPPVPIMAPANTSEGKCAPT